jgi:hypothetical protein
MAKTLLITVNDVGDPEQVIAQTVCREIVIGEDRSVVGYPTTDYKVRMAESTSDPVQVQAGVLYAFTNPRYFQPGEVVGYVETVTGSTSFFQDEH